MSADDLDTPARLSEADPGGMLAAVEGLPEQCREAWETAKRFELPGEYGDVDRIVVLGMGGSAIAGDFLRVLMQRECRVPVFNVRGYDLPPFVDERTLVIASSFSGGTEETVAAFKQALGTPAKKLVISSGGGLLATARANGVPSFTYTFQGEPRAALGWSLMPLLAVAEKLGFMQGVERDVDEMLGVLDGVRREDGTAAAGGEARELARALHEKLPVIYGAGLLTEAAHRWKTQLNESSKVWAFYEELPEVHHNAIIGYGLPKRIASDTAVVFLESSDLVHPRVRLRYDFTRRLLDEAGVRWTSASTRGRSALAQLMSLVMLGDYASVYLAFLCGVDPTPTTVIDELKVWLTRQG